MKLSFAIFLAASGLGSTASSQANPVGQVLSLLQKLYDTVVSDGETEQKQYEEFAEWCEDQAKERQYEVKTGKAQAADLRATIEKAAADIEALNSQIGGLAQSIATNEADLKAATDIRENENQDFKKEEKELVETVDTLSRAQSVLARHLEKGGSFAQMPQAMKDLTTSLSVIMDAAVFSTRDKRQLQAFLQQNDEGVNQPQAAAYESHSSGILDTLADMQEKAEGMLAEARKTEMNAQHAYELLAQSLNDEVSVQNEDMSNAKKQLGATGETKATAEGDLAATVKDLNEDQAYLGDLSTNCQQRAVDWETSQKSRAEELHALSEAKKIIAEATGGAAQRQYRGFFQVSAKSKGDISFEEVEAAIKKVGKRENSFVLTQLAGQIRAAVSMSADPFAKVKGLISSMIDRLLKEAQEEASHKAFCDKETSTNEKKRDQLKATVNKLSTRMERDTARIAKLKEEIAGLQAALAQIAKSQKEMDAMRQQEHQEFVAAEKDFEQGVNGIRSALQILREYYQNEGGAFVQQPAVGTHAKSSDSASGIIGILEVAESDFARSLAESRATEDEAQNVYDTTSQDNKVSKVTKETSVKGKTQEISQLEQAISDNGSDRDGTQEELSAVMEYLDKLRPQCTTQPESYEERKKRREHEIEGLKQAMDILENETAFIQEGTFLRRIQRHA